MTNFENMTWVDIFLKTDTVFTLILSTAEKIDLISAFTSISHGADDRTFTASLIGGDSITFRLSSVESIVVSTPKGRDQGLEFKRYMSKFLKEPKEPWNDND